MPIHSLTATDGGRLQKGVWLMIELRRFAAVGGVVALAAMMTNPNLWGDPGKDRAEKTYHKGDGTTRTVPSEAASEEAADRFADKPVARYEDQKTGESLVALQIQPKLAD